MACLPLKGGYVKKFIAQSILHLFANVLLGMLVYVLYKTFNSDRNAFWVTIVAFTAFPALIWAAIEVDK
jgi:hypothetical protein